MMYYYYYYYVLLLYNNSGNWKGGTRWNSPQSVSQNVETVSPILETLSPIVETLTADVEMLSPIGEILSLIVETLSADMGILGTSYWSDTVSYLGDTILSVPFWETPRGEFHLLSLSIGGVSYRVLGRS